MKKIIIFLFLSIAHKINAQPIYDFGKFSSHAGTARCYTAVDAQSNFYVANSFTNTVNIDPSNNSYNYSSNGFHDIYVVKYNSVGVIQWVTKFGGINQEIIRDMELDSQGNILIIGDFQSNNFDTGLGGILTTNGSNTFLIKISSDTGNVIWAKSFQGTNSTNRSRGWGLDIDGNDNIIITGEFSGTVDFDPSESVSNKTAEVFSDIFVAKFNSTGNLQWVNGYGGSSSELGFKVYCDSNNNIFCNGTFGSSSLDFDPNSSAGIINHNPNPNTDDAYLVKLNPNGDFVWGIQFTEAYLRKITTDTQGNIYGVGSFSATTDFNPSSNVLNKTSVSLADAFTIKLNSNGELSWVKTMGATSYNDGRSVALDTYGNVYTVGSFSGINTDFDSSIGTSYLSSVGGQDYYIQKLDNDGNFIWAVGGGSANNEMAWDITIDGNGKCYVVGTMPDSGDIDPTLGIDNRTGSGIFFVRLSSFTNSNPVTSNKVIIASTLSDNGNNVPIVFQDQSGVISSVTPSGVNPLVGQVTAKVWISTTGIGSYLNKNYEITPETNANTSTGKVTIYFTQQEFDDYNLLNEIDLPNDPNDDFGKSNLKIDKYSGTSFDGSGTPQSYNTTPILVDPIDSDIIWNSNFSRWEVSFSVNGFSGFFVKPLISTPLPLTLINFSAKPQENQILLTWKTTNETNFSHFEIQKSENGKEFGAIGNVNSTKSSFYNFNDTNPNEGLNYYKLKMVDLDGTSTFSKTISINFEKNGYYLLVENPVKNGEFLVRSNYLNPSFTLLNSLGQKIGISVSESSDNQYKIKAETINAGVYFLMVESGGKVVTRKVLMD